MVLEVLKSKKDFNLEELRQQWLNELQLPYSFLELETWKKKLFIIALKCLCHHAS